MPNTKTKAAPEFSLYLITGGDAENDAGFFDNIKHALDAGVRAVQLREKNLSGRALLAAAERLRLLTHGYGALLFVNDRADVAAMAGADGVHLGQNGISPADARKVMGEEAIVGVSAHNLTEALKAQEGRADFITFGPVYHTPSKAQWGTPLGLEPLKEAAKLLNIPVYAIGGIGKNRIEEVVASGASGVAVISAILSSPDVRKSAEELIAELNRVKAQR